MSDNRRQAAAQLTALLLAVAVVLFGRPAVVSTIGTAPQVEGSVVTHGRSIVVADSTTSRAEQGPLTTSASERHSTRHRDRASACVCREGQAPAAYAYDSNIAIAACIDSTPACRTRLGADSLQAAVTTSATSTTARFVIAAEAASPGTALVKYSYPPNRGFMGSPVRTTLKPGTVVDRYGANSGTFVSPQGTSFAQRSLPPSSLNKPFNTYEVVNPVDVQAGTVTPWFGQGGGGVQYEFGQSIADLIEGGFLKVVG